MASLTEKLTEVQEKLAETEKEQEDLLVLLDEMNAKRRRDKERLREAGQDVSEDEASTSVAGDDDEVGSGHQGSPLTCFCHRAVV